MDDKEAKANRTVETYRDQWLKCCWNCRSRLIAPAVKGGPMVCGLRAVAADWRWSLSIVSPLAVCGEWEQENPDG